MPGVLLLLRVFVVVVYVWLLKFMGSAIVSISFENFEMIFQITMNTFLGICFYLTLIWSLFFVFTFWNLGVICFFFGFENSEFKNTILLQFSMQGNELFFQISKYTWKTKFQPSKWQDFLRPKFLDTFLPKALHRSEKEGGRRLHEPSHYI